MYCFKNKCPVPPQSNSKTIFISCAKKFVYDYKKKKNPISNKIVKIQFIHNLWVHLGK